ncbi:biotin carboxyl carrier protein of acetyl-CoA carboxylase-like [Impatiens glandulifera]|uniref:biotin carboxyl carrier protein of acetyl-CoA carboxylase-like n=1 Tax=Impatiens glandulifera TaxID=253017 RepID=UPI001FB0EE70|nr:biotin carboxyl carrier protein of acetyl-CoA carboxylase-like [Impatiens glandulifera]
MAASSFGASSIKISHLNSGSTRLSALQTSNGLRMCVPVRYNNLLISRRSEKAMMTGLCLSRSQLANTNSEDDSPAPESELIPSSYDVETLLGEICDTESIAEFELKLGGFRLYVMRDLKEKIEPPSLPVIATPVTVNIVSEVKPEPNGSVSSTSLAITKTTTTTTPSSSEIQTLLNTAADEGLLILPSPRVGYFRRSRTIKGKRAPPSCKEKQSVKEGQVLCYIEQLGGEIPIESDVSGEIIKILRKDGDPVGYGDALMAILPSFPGIKKLQ